MRTMAIAQAPTYGLLEHTNPFPQAILHFTGTHRALLGTQWPFPHNTVANTGAHEGFAPHTPTIPGNTNAVHRNTTAVPTNIAAISRERNGVSWEYNGYPRKQTPPPPEHKTVPSNTTPGSGNMMANS